MTSKQKSKYDKTLEMLARKLADYNWTRKQLIIQVMPVKDNELLLFDTPHIIKEDLAFIVRVNLVCGVSIPVSYSMLHTFGISEARLFEDAIINMVRDYPIIIEPDFVALEGVSPEDSILFVCMSDNMPGGKYGASVLLHPKFVEAARQVLGGDFYILPSSMNEVILIKAGEKDLKDTLLESVKSLNEEEVEMEYKLTESVYFCDRYGFRKIA